LPQRIAGIQITPFFFSNWVYAMPQTRIVSSFSHNADQPVAVKIAFKLQELGSNSWIEAYFAI